MDIDMTQDIALAVAELDNAPRSGDMENIHVEAEEVLLSWVPKDIADAYLRLRNEADWWAYA